jgi:thiamine transport system permease protein
LPRAHLSLAIALAFLTFFWLAPLVTLAGMGGTFWSVLADSYYLRIAGWTLLQALLSSAIVGALALPTAWMLEHFSFKGRSAYKIALLLPFLTPVLVTALGLNALFGGHGFLPLAVGESPFLLLYANVFYNIGLVVWFVDAGFGRIPARLLQSAQLLGASPWHVFRRVEWPIIRPSFIAALCLTFLFCLNSFGLALLLAGNRYATLEVEIYRQTAFTLDLPTASALAQLQALFCAFAALLQAHFDRALPLKPQGQVERPGARHGQGRKAAFLWLGMLGILLLAPLVSVALRSFMTENGWSLGHYRRLAADSAFPLALANSLRFTLLTVGAAGIMGIVFAIAIHRHPRGNWLAFAPYLVSPTAVALGYLLLYPSWLASPLLLIGGYSLFAYPFVARQLTLAWHALPRGLALAARTLGAGPLRTAQRIFLPLLWPAMRQGLALAGASALGEFAVTLFLARPEWLSLPRLVYERLGRPGSGNLGEAYATATILLLLAWLTLALIGRWHVGAARHR